MSDALTLALGLVFAWAAAAKVRARPRFEDSLATWRIVPPSLVPLVAGIVVAAEATGAIAVTLWPFPVAVVLGALIAAASVLALVARARGARPVCACFSSTPTPWGSWALARNGGLVGLAAAVASMGDGPMAPSFAIVLAGVVLALSFVVLEHAAKLWSLPAVAADPSRLRAESR